VTLGRALRLTRTAAGERESGRGKGPQSAPKAELERWKGEEIRNTWRGAKCPVSLELAELIQTTTRKGKAGGTIIPRDGATRREGPESVCRQRCIV